MHTKGKLLYKSDITVHLDYTLKQQRIQDIRHVSSTIAPPCFKLLKCNLQLAGTHSFLPGPPANAQALSVFGMQLLAVGMT